MKTIGSEMKLTKSKLPDILVLEPTIFSDDRGHFFESFNQSTFNNLTGLDLDFVQDNISQSHKGVLRGIHYQIAPKAQGKLVQVLHGAVFDVAVDLRRSSETFAQWVGYELSAENRKKLWIPAGFGHGFYSLSNETKVHYKTTAYYSPEHERSITWSDETLSIDWNNGIIEPQLSEKDLDAQPLNRADFFK